MSETDSNEPYDDDYSFSNQFDRILWRPGHPLFQKELNEHQSSEINNLRLMFDDGIHMPNGTILSGMGVSVLGRTGSNKLPDGTHENLFTFGEQAGVSKVNHESYGCFNTMNTGNITNDVDSYDKTGEINYQSDATDDSDNLGLDIFYPQPTDGQKTVTLSFDIERTSGILNNISILPVGGTVVDNATFDDMPVAGDITNNSGENSKVLQNGSPSVFPLSDGNSHHVVITFNNSNVNSQNNVEFQLLFNRGFSALAGCGVKLVNFKIEEGANVTAWESSTANNADPKGNDRTDMVDVSNGSLYLNGQPRQFDEQEIGIVGQGSEQIGVKLLHDVVTSNQDQALVDHSAGSQTEDDAGADREHYTVKLVYGSANADAVLFHFQDGQYVSGINSGQYDKLNTILATRTYEQSGSFLSDGMGIMPHADPFDADMIDLQIQEGTAYVLGNRIHTNGTESIQIPTETHAGHIPDEPSEPFSTDSTGQSYKLIYPSLQPVVTNAAKLDKNTNLDPGIAVRGIVPNVNMELDGVEPGYNDLTNNNLVPGESLGPDAYVLDPSELNGISTGLSTYEVYVIIGGVTYRADESTYHFGPDPQAGGHEALIIDDDDKFSTFTSLDNQTTSVTAGDSIYVQADVNRLFVDANTDNMPSDFVTEYLSGGYSSGKGSNYDYHLVFVNQDGTVTGTQNYNDPTQKVAIDFNNDGKNQPKGTKVSGIKPLLGTRLTLDYDAYKSRDDLILLNANGTFHDVQGQPDFEDSVEPPTNPSENGNQTLTIGWVHVEPNSQMAESHESSIPALPFSSIDDMALEINTLQDNQAILAARMSASSQINPLHLEDTFSDLFVTHDNADISATPQYDLRYSPNQFIEPGYAAEGDLPLSVQYNEVPGQARMIRNTSAGSINYLNQDYANATLQLNRGTTLMKKGKIVCDPDVFHDHYADRVIGNRARIASLNALKAQNQVNHAKGVPDAMPYTKGGDYDIGGLDLSRNQINDIKQGNYKTNTYKNLEHTTTTLKYVNQAYMCPQWIHISGSGFTPNADNLSAKILTGSGSIPCVTTADGSKSNLEALNVSQDNRLYGSDNFNNYTSNPSLYKGSSSNTVKADNNGNISCWFQLPETIHCGHRHVCLSNGIGDYAETVIDGTADTPTYHNTLNDLYINSGTLSDHHVDWEKHYMHMTDLKLQHINDHFHEVDKFNSSAASSIYQLQNNLASNTASLNAHIGSVTDSLSAEEADESATVDSMYNEQQSVNLFVSNQLDANEDSIDSLSNKAAANSASAASNYSAICSIAYSTANGFASADAQLNSLGLRANSDEDSIFSNAVQEGMDKASLTTDVNDAVAIGVNASQAAAQAGADAAYDYSYANSASQSASIATVNAQNSIAAESATESSNAASARKAEQYNKVSQYNTPHRLILAEFSAEGGDLSTNTRNSSGITANAVKYLLDILGPGSGAPYGPNSRYWAGSLNSCYNQAVQSGTIILPGKADDNAGNSNGFNPVTVISAGQSWHDRGSIKQMYKETFIPNGSVMRLG